MSWEYSSDVMQSGVVSRHSKLRSNHEPNQMHLLGGDLVGPSETHRPDDDGEQTEAEVKGGKSSRAVR